MRTLIIILAFLLLLTLPMWYVWITGDFPGARWFYGIQEDSELVRILLEWSGK
jgi:hypothetical protein